jgi:tight adherence protein B
MRFDPLYLLYAAIFIAAVLAIEGVYYLFSDVFAGRRAANRRMTALARGVAPADVLAQLRRQSIEAWDSFGSLARPLAALDKLIAQAGMTVTLQQLLIGMGVAGVATAAAAISFAWKAKGMPAGGTLILLALLGGVAAGIVLPVAVLMRMRAKRAAKFAEQLPDALDMMVRSLRAGHPVTTAMELAARQMADPIGTELGLAVDEMTYGIPLREALQKVGDRVDQPDFQFVVVAISIQSETGGNLAEVLEGLSTVIRDRFRMMRKVQALAAQARFSGKFLGAMPFVFAAFTYSTKPDYYLKVMDDPMFVPVVVVALVLQLAGLAIMSRLINFKV